jgi:hypothetical protein
MPPAYEILLLNTAIPQIQAAQTGDTYVVPRDIAFSAALTLSAGTANGVPYLNGSKVVTTGSALTFNGTVLAVSSLDTRLTLTSTGSGQTVGISIKGGAGSGDAFNFLESLNNDGTQAWYVGGNGVANTLAFKTNGNNERARITSTGEFQWKPDGTTQSMTLDASGNLGVGETSMGTIRLVVKKNDATSYSTSNMGAQTHTFLNNTTNGGFSNLILGCASATSGSAVYAGVAVVSEQASDTNGALAFGTRGSGGANITERARITSGGYFKASDNGTYLASTGSYHELDSSDASNAAVIIRATNASFTGNGLQVRVARNTTDATFFAIRYYNEGAAADKFLVADSGDVTNTNGTYGTISDQKMKTDIVDAGSQWSDIKALRFRKFKMKDDPSGLVQLGVVAQEVELTSPGLVDEHQDRDAEGNDLGTTTKSVKTSVLLMKAAVALQEAMARIETLEAKIAALEAK